MGTRLTPTSIYRSLSTPILQASTDWDGQDPREALLKLDAVTKAQPVFLGRAYRDSQAAVGLAQSTLEEELEEQNRAAKKARPS